MPLSAPTERELIHIRKVECRGYRRADGLWDIEGHLTDTKTYAWRNYFRGAVESGTPIHEMWLRLTVDDHLLIHQAEASSDYFPFGVCPSVAPDFAKLKGLRIGPGWRKGVQQLVGGARGCTHLVELMAPLATAAYQTIYPLREQREDALHPARARSRPEILDTCHALRSDGEVVRMRWPEFYTGT